MLAVVNLGHKGSHRLSTVIRCMYTVPLWLWVLKALKAAQLPAVCGLILSDLFKSPLLHVLQLVFPLEPKRGKVGKTLLKTIHAMYKFANQTKVTEMVLTWLFLSAQSDSSSEGS